MPQTPKNPTAEALATAARNAARDASRYVVQHDDIFEGAATVYRADAPKTRRYRAWRPGTLEDYPHGKCDCPYFEQEGACKHPLIAQDDYEYTKAVETRLEAMEDAIGEDCGRY